MASSRALTSFKCLTFDCYGTLIDWERGIFVALRPLTARLPDSHPLKNDRLSLLRAFTRHEGAVQAAEPTALYRDILASAYGRLAAETGVRIEEAVLEEEKAAFGGSVGDWPVYPDTVDALTRLARHFQLVILSNVDNASFQQTRERQLAGFPFDAVHTAQDIGSYKPDVRNFEYLIRRCEEQLGVRKQDILHTAQSLKHDHEPAKEIGLESVWIARRGGGGEESVMGGEEGEFEGRVAYLGKLESLGLMADAVDAEMGVREGMN